MVGNMYALKIVRHRDKHKGRQMLKRHAIRVLLYIYVIFSNMTWPVHLL